MQHKEMTTTTKYYDKTSQISHLKKEARKEHTLRVRIDFDTVDILHRIAREAGVTISDVVRHSIHSFEPIR